MASPLRFEPHAEPHGNLMIWLGNYKVATPVRLGDNPTVRLDLDNEPQPDAILLIDAACGGSSHLSTDGYVEGAPELVAEVAASSASKDLYDKKRAYRRNGIQEYIVWQVFDSTVSWFSLQNGEYVALIPNALGIIQSQVFPGLWLDVSAISCRKYATSFGSVAKRAKFSRASNVYSADKYLKPFKNAKLHFVLFV